MFRVHSDTAKLIKLDSFFQLGNYERLWEKSGKTSKNIKIFTLEQLL